jgi:hypothetical protein
MFTKMAVLIVLLQPDDVVAAIGVLTVKRYTQSCSFCNSQSYTYTLTLSEQ